MCGSLAEVRRDAGELDEAQRLAEASLSIAVDAGDRRVEADACHTLATLDRLCGGSGTSWDTRALMLAQAGGYRRGQALALLGLAGAHLAGGSPAQAAATAADALDISRRAGYRLVEAQALTMLAAVRSASG